MGPRSKASVIWGVLFASAIACGTWGCERPAGKSEGGGGGGKRPTVVSLVPGATDLLLGMGLGEHVVAVSSYCKLMPGTEKYPTAGDYQNTDWERLGTLRPDVMIVFVSADRIPPGMKDRADAIGMRVVNLKTETTADVLETMTLLGELTNEREGAAKTRAELEVRLSAMKSRGATRRSGVRTLIVIGGDGKFVAGPGGFLDELLTAAGGVNVMEGERDRYASIDVERLRALRPERIVQLMPSASEGEVKEARKLWGKLADELPAARDVTVLTEWFLLTPGWRLPETGELIERAVHGASKGGDGSERGSFEPRGSGAGTLGRGVGGGDVLIGARWCDVVRGTVTDRGGICRRSFRADAAADAVPPAADAVRASGGAVRAGVDGGGR